MSSRKYSPFPNWTALANARNAKWHAKQAAARAAARSAVVAVTRGNYLPPRLPVVLPARPNIGRTSSTEVKSYDTGVRGNTLVDVTAVTGTEPGTLFGGITCLNEVLQGAAFYNRIGSKIKMISLHVKFDIFQGTTTAGAFANSRYMIVYDRQPNGAFPTISTLPAVNDSAPTTSTACAGINMANRSRFTVLIVTGKQIGRAHV